MADVSVLTFNGAPRNVKDVTARNTANAATTAQEYDRQQLTGTYKGRSIESVFAAEIGSANVWTWLQKRVKAANFTGLRIGDYIDVQLKAGANVPSQTVRYRIAAIDPYYQCGDTPKGHHIAMVPSAPVSVTGDKAVNGSYIIAAQMDMPEIAPTRNAARLTSLIICMGLFVSHGALGVPESCGGWVNDYTQNREHGEQRVDDGCELFVKNAEIPLVSERSRAHLNKQEHSRDERQPKRLVLDSSRNVNHCSSPCHKSGQRGRRCDRPCSPCRASGRETPLSRYEGRRSMP